MPVVLGFLSNLDKDGQRKFLKSWDDTERTKGGSHKPRDAKGGCQRQVLEGAWSDSPPSLRRSPPCGHPDSDFQPPELRGSLLFPATQLVVLCYGSPGKLLRSWISNFSYLRSLNKRCALYISRAMNKIVGVVSVKRARPLSIRLHAHKDKNPSPQSIPLVLIISFP